MKTDQVISSKLGEAEFPSRQDRVRVPKRFSLFESPMLTLTEDAEH